jgi:hypothetical protein
MMTSLPEAQVCPETPFIQNSIEKLLLAPQLKKPLTETTGTLMPVLLPLNDWAR